MKNNKILIVEDEQIIAENLRFILNDYGYHYVDVAIDITDAMQQFEQNNYALVLMDINLGEHSDMDGIDLIKFLSKKYTFSYVYITANADEKTIEKAKTTKPSGYIVKPFINNAIFANVEMALNEILKNDSFTYMNKGIKQKVKIASITHIVADGAYINIYTLDGKKHFTRKSLTEFSNEVIVPFIRIHKSILINKDYIEGYTSKIVKVNDKRLPLGRTYKEQFLNLWACNKI